MEKWTNERLTSPVEMKANEINTQKEKKTKKQIYMLRNYYYVENIFVWTMNHFCCFFSLIIEAQWVISVHNSTCSIWNVVCYVMGNRTEGEREKEQSSKSRCFNIVKLILWPSMHSTRLAPFTTTANIYDLHRESEMDITCACRHCIAFWCITTIKGPYKCLSEINISPFIHLHSYRQTDTRLSTWNANVHDVNMNRFSPVWG